MIRSVFYSLPSAVFVALIFSPYIYALDAQYVKQETIYKKLCNILERPNIDCQCVAKSHATFSHLSPNDHYADYLVESYKEKLGLPNQQDDAFKRYLDGRTINNAQIEMFNAFDEYDRANPFVDEVNGCVIPNTPKVTLAPLPSAPIFKEVFDYRVSSTSAKRYEQCRLVETSNVLSADELAAWHYVDSRGLGEAEIMRKLNVSEVEAQNVARIARTKMQNHQKSQRNFSNYCMSLLAAEDNYGALQTRFMRPSEQRAGAPKGLENIDIMRNRPEVPNAFANNMTNIQDEIKAINKQNVQQPSAEELMSDMNNIREFQEAKTIQNTQPQSATTSLLSRGCEGAARSDTFCSCFVESFMADIGESGGSAALPVISDGLSNVEVMALMKSIDQSRYMQDMLNAQAISEKCETIENTKATSQLSAIDGTAEERYKAVCKFNNNESEQFCSCASKHLAKALSERELNTLTNIEIIQRQVDESEIASLASDMGMSESQLMQQMAGSSQIISARMGLISACMQY